MNILLVPMSGLPGVELVNNDVNVLFPLTEGEGGIATLVTTLNVWSPPANKNHFYTFNIDSA